MGEPSDEAGVGDNATSKGSGRPSVLLRDSVRDEVFIEIRGNTSIVNDRWKMGLYPDDDEGDLYDLVDDPFELINRYDDPAFREVREELTRKTVEFSPAWPPTFSVNTGE